MKKIYDDIYQEIDPEHKGIIKYLTYAVLVLSLFGSFLIIVIYLLHKNLRNFSFSLIINLTVSVAIQDISKLMSIRNDENTDDDPHNHIFCMVGAYFLNYSQLSTLFWSSIISWSLYSTVILLRKKITTDQDRFYLLGFGTPAAISLIPLISNDYGVFELGCWIKNNGLRATIIRIICYYLPLFLGSIVNFFLIKKVRFYVNSALPDDPSTIFLNRLKWYPYLLFLILITFAVKVVALVILNSNETALYIVLIFTTCFANLLGIYNFIIFGYTKSVKEAILTKFKEVFEKSIRESEEFEQEESEKPENNSNSNSDASDKVFLYDRDKENYYKMNN